MDMPPSRYRVEERGRRLVVIDRASGREVTPAESGTPLVGGESRKRRGPMSAAGLSSSPSGSGTQARKFGLRRTHDTPDSFVTRSWFDAKAPRAIKLNYGTRARLSSLRLGGAIVIALFVACSTLFWPWFPFTAAAILTLPKMRAQLREASTRWLDGFDQAD